MRALLIALWLTAVASADDGPIVIERVSDITPHLPPAGARSWDPAPLVAAIAASPATFTPADAYTLVDAEAHPEVIAAVCARAALFYDPDWLPLAAQIERGRRGQRASTIPLTASTFVVLFEFFNDVNNDIAAVDDRLGPLVQGDSETASMFERRSRKHIEDRIAGSAPHEGRVEATTFDITLTATSQERDGCRRGVAAIDLSHLDFSLFRLGMGVKRSYNDVNLRSSSIDRVRFDTQGGAKFEVLGACGTSGGKVALTMTRTFEGEWSGSGRL